MSQIEQSWIFLAVGWIESSAFPEIAVADMTMTPNHALQRIRPSRFSFISSLLWAGSLSLIRWAALEWYVRLVIVFTVSLSTLRAAPPVFLSLEPVAQANAPRSFDGLVVIHVHSAAEAFPRL